jgi:pimeloyl-ACP methyl ester carboxylesterase
VITFDLPGFGLTGPWAGAYAASAYRADAWARFTLDVLDALKVQRFVVGGNSLGGEVAWRVALLAPQRVERLILVDASGEPFQPEALPLGWRLALLPGAARVLEHLLPRPLVHASVVDVYGDPVRVDDALVDRYYELTLRAGNRRALVERLREALPLDESARIASLTLPTLILWGGRDRVIPPAVAERFHRDIAGSVLERFDTLGHVPHEEDPAATVAPVKAFLQIAG